MSTQAGADLANLDYSVDLQAASEQLPRTCLSGNLKPVAFVDAGAEAIRAESERLLAAFAPRRGFILAPGCEIPPEAPPANVDAMLAAAR